jgi:glycosyltransferase involved in cell wall biosynthesis
VNLVYVFLRPGKPQVYGGEKSMIITAQGAAARGHRVRCLVTARDDLLHEIERAGLEVEVVDGIDPIAGLRKATARDIGRRLTTIARLNKRVFELVSEERPAIVHVSGVPAVVTTLPGAKLAGGAVVYHVRDTSRTGDTRWYEELCVLAADRSVAISESLRARILETARPAARRAMSRRLVAIYNGFDFAEMDAFCASVTREDARASLSIGADEMLAVSVGAVNEKKGQLRFIERALSRAVATTPKLRMVFIGGVNDEGYAGRCKVALARTGLTHHVQFVGYAPQAITYRWLRAAEIGVVASSREGLSRFAVEAHAFGLPVVSTRIVGPVDVVVDGTTGYLIDEASIERMGDTIAELAADAALRARLGAAASSHVRKKFVLDRHHDEIAKLYASI